MSDVNTMRAISQDVLGGPEVLKEVPVRERHGERRQARLPPGDRRGRADQGKQKATIAGTFPLADAAKAHELGDTGRTTGKLVLLAD